MGSLSQLVAQVNSKLSNKETQVIAEDNLSGTASNSETIFEADGVTPSQIKVTTTTVTISETVKFYDPVAMP